ncbi:MAG: coproporphyrinogen III oxidase [Actinobacteria bacterium]|nr:coproporphyrinogen III oxidase [Actinomycetota bacterium]
MGALPAGEPWPLSNQLQSLRNSGSFHAYVHIPFCEVRCGYCDFNTYTSSELGEVKRSDFHNALINEIQFSKRVLGASGIETTPLQAVFFGGGTPSLMAADQISVVLAELQSVYGFDSDIEITLEANPESTTEGLLERLWEAGVNRISFGAQSFDPDVLRVLDRTHRPELLKPLIDSAKSIGFRTSLDLIYGAPGESIDSWKSTVERALSLGTEHISAYSLIVEEGTKLAKQVSRGELADVDEDLNAEKYEWASSEFAAHGLDWYEISNWGNPSIHNMAYWESRNWWGYGPGAHSHINGNRFWNRKHPLAHQKALEQGAPAIGWEAIDVQTHLVESVMLRLRTKQGFPKALLSELGVPAEKVAKYLALGQLKMDRDRIYISESGRLLADGIALDLVSSLAS